MKTRITWHAVSLRPKDGTRVLVLLSGGEIRSGVAEARYVGGFQSEGISLGGWIRGEPVLWAKFPRISAKSESPNDKLNRDTGL